MTTFTATATLTLTDLDLSAARGPNSAIWFDGRVAVTLAYEDRKMTLKADSGAYLEADGSITLAAQDGSCWIQAADEGLTFDAGILLRDEPSREEQRAAEQAVKAALADPKIRRNCYQFDAANEPGVQTYSDASGNAILHLGDGFGVNVATGEIFTHGDLDERFVPVPPDVLASRPADGCDEGWLEWVIKARQSVGID